MQNDKKNKLTELRRQAKELFKNNPELYQQNYSLGNSITELIEELSTYQIELELQNDTLTKTQKELLDTQKELEDAKKKYFNLFEFSPVGYIAFNCEYHIEEVNQTAVEMFGLSKTAFIKHPITYFIDNQWQDAFYFHLKDLQKTHTKQRCELKMKHPQGKELFVLIESKCFGDTLIYASVTDITSRVQTEKALKESEKKYRMIADNTSDVIWVSDANGGLNYISPSVEKLLGYTPEEVLHQSIKDLHTFASYSEALEIQDYFKQQANNADDTDIRKELEQIRKDGSTVWVEVISNPLRDDNNRLTGFIGIARNITEQKRTNQKLFEVSQRLELATQIGNIGIWQWNIVDNYVIWDDVTHFIFDYKRGEFDGSFAMFKKRIHHDDKEMVEEVIFDSLDKKKPYIIDFRVVWKNGTVRYITVRGKVFYYDGKPEKMLGICMDITSRKETELELEEKHAIVEGIVQNLNGGVLLERKDRTIELVNQRFAEIFKVKQPNVQNWIGKDCRLASRQSSSLFVYPDKFMNRIEETIVSKKNVISEIMELYDGRILERDYIPFFIRNQYYGHLWYYRDITHQKAIEKELRLHKENLTALVQERTEELATANEELTTTNEELRSNMEEIRSINEQLNKEVRQRQATEQNLLITNNRLELALATGELAWWDWNFRTGELKYDQNKAAFLGYKPKELENSYTAFTSKVHPDDYERVMAEMQVLIDNKTEIYDTEYRIQSKSSAWKWFYDRGKVIKRCKDNKPLRIVGITADITNRKKMEQKLYLILSEQKALLDSIPAFVYFKDINLKYITYNKSFAKRTGISAFEAKGKTDFDFSPKDIAERYRKRDQEVLHSGKALMNVVEHFKTNDNNDYWTLTSKTPYRDNDGKIIGLVGTTLDITKQKQAEQALHNTIAEQKALLAAIPAYVYFKDAEFRYITYNDAFARLTGIPPEKAKGKVDYDISPKHIADLYRKTDEKVINTGKPIYNLEEEFQTENNHSYWTLTSKVPVLDPQNDVKGLVGITIDITKRKQMEEALRESEEKFRQLAENIEDVFWITDVKDHFRVIYVNNAYKKIWKNKPEDLYSNPDLWMEAIVEDDRNNVETKFNDFIADRTDYKVTYRIKQPDKTIRWITDRGFKIYDSNNQLIRVVGIAQDITQKRLTEQAVKESEEKYRLISENMTDVIIVLNSSLCYQYISPSIEKYGYKTNELIDTCFKDKIHPEDRNKVLSEINNENNNNQLQVYAQYRFKSKASKYIWVETIFTRLNTTRSTSSNYQALMRNINEQKAWEIKMLQSEKRYRTVAENFPNGAIILYDKDLRFLLLDGQALQQAGMDKERFLGKTLYEVFPKRVTDFLVPKYEAALQGKKQHFDLDTSRGTHEVNIVPIKDEQGKIHQAVILTHDISDRKQAEEKLRKSEQRFRSYFELGLIGIAITSPEKGWLEMNGRLCEILGYPKDELQSKTWAEITHPDDLKQDEAYFEEVIAGAREGYEYQKRFIRKDEQVIYADISARCLRKPSGDVDYFVAIVNDITERKKAEEQIKQQNEEIQKQNEELTSINEELFTTSEALKMANDELAKAHSTLTTILDNVNAGVYVVDFNSHEVLFVNKYFKEIYGDIKGEPCWKHFQNQNKPCDFCNSPQLLDENKKPTDVLFWEDKDMKTDSWYYKATSAIHWIDGRLVRLEIATDISELKEVQEQLQKALERQKEVNKLKSAFVSIASHQFRTPLTTIQSSIELLQMYTEQVNDEIKPMLIKHFIRILDEINRLNELMNDILLLGRIEAGKTPFNPAKTNLIKFCKSLISQNFSFKHGNRSVKFSYSGNPKDVFIDQKLMNHAIGNLLSNAYKYSENNPEMHLQFDENNFKINIKDNGIGIPDEDLPNLFQSFFRAGNVKNIQGTGLGLAIVKQFVNLHNGSIEVETELHKGTEFQITIPYKISNSNNSKFKDSI